MTLKRILSAVMAGVLAVTTAVSGLSLSAGAVSEKVTYTGYGYDLTYIPSVYKAASGQEEGMFEYEKNVWYIVADLEPTDVITFKAITEKGKEYVLYMKLSSNPNYFVSQSTACYEESGISVQKLIDCYNEDLHMWDFSGEWVGKNVTFNSVTSISVPETTYWFADSAFNFGWEYNTKDLEIYNEFCKGQKRFNWEITIEPGASVKKVSPPTTLKSTPVTPTSTKLTWKSTAGSFNIYRATSKNGTYKKIGTSTKASYTDKGLSKGKTYYYKVTAVSGGKESEFSSIVSAKACAPAPTSVKATKSADGKAKLTWKKSAGAEGYEVYMATSSKGSFSKIKTLSKGTTIGITKSGLTSGKTYYFKVRSYITVNGKKVYSGYSKTVKVKV